MTAEPDYPPQQAAPPAAPNILLVLLDDVGYGWASTFGGLVEMPTLDRLAEDGLRYCQFHTTALCSNSQGHQPHCAPRADPIVERASADERRLYSRFAENYADFLAHTDYEVGRVVEAKD